MKHKRFDDLTYIFLVNASQMAYLEDAHKTHAMLQKFNELYRYMIKNDNAAMLGEELRALRNYMDIQTSRHEGRFSISLVNSLESSDIYVKHLCLLDFTDNIMSSALARYESYFSVYLELNCHNEICMTASLEAGSGKETFNITLTEEGK